MFLVNESDQRAILEARRRSGDLGAAVELRRRFPAIKDNEEALRCVGLIIGWTPVAPPSPSADRSEDHSEEKPAAF